MVHHKNPTAFFANCGYQPFQTHPFQLIMGYTDPSWKGRKLFFFVCSVQDIAWLMQISLSGQQMFGRASCIICINWVDLNSPAAQHGPWHSSYASSRTLESPWPMWVTILAEVIEASALYHVQGIDLLIPHNKPSQGRHRNSKYGTSPLLKPCFFSVPLRLQCTSAENWKRGWKLKHLVAHPT